MPLGICSWLLVLTGPLVGVRSEPFHTDINPAALCGNDALAEELAQDTLVEAWKSLRRYNGRCKFFTWLGGSMLNWRVALPTIAAVVIALLAMLAPRHPRAVSPPAPLAAQSGSESSSGSDLAPTLANYQMVANESLEKLLELLTRQGNKSLPPAPVYTISGLEPAKVPF